MPAWACGACTRQRAKVICWPTSGVGVLNEASTPVSTLSGVVTPGVAEAMVITAEVK